MPRHVIDHRSICGCKALKSPKGTKARHLFKGLRLTAGRRPTWVCGAYVTPMLALVGPILSKVKLSGAHLGPRLGQVGPMWCMLGTSWAQVEPMLAYVGLC